MKWQRRPPGVRREQWVGRDRDGRMSLYAGRPTARACAESLLAGRRLEGWWCGVNLVRRGRELFVRLLPEPNERLSFDWRSDEWGEVLEALAPMLGGEVTVDPDGERWIVVRGEGLVTLLEVLRRQARSRGRGPRLLVEAVGWACEEAVLEVREPSAEQLLRAVRIRGLQALVDARRGRIGGLGRTVAEAAWAMVAFSAPASDPLKAAELIEPLAGLEPTSRRPQWKVVSLTPEQAARALQGEARLQHVLR